MLGHEKWVDELIESKKVDIEKFIRKSANSASNSQEIYEDGGDKNVSDHEQEQQHFTTNIYASSKFVVGKHKCKQKCEL
jgi:hypothetical protein